LLQGWQQLFFRASPPQGVLALDRGDRLDGVCAADRAHACFRHPEVFHLSLPDQVSDGSCHVFDRHVGVDTVLVIEIDDVGLEPFQRPLDALLDALGPAVLHLVPAGITSDPELGGDHHLSAHRRQRLPDELFVGVRTVDFGGIEERDAALDGRADQRNHRLLVRRETVALAHAHAAEPQRRHLEVGLSKFASLHWSLPQGFTMTLIVSRSFIARYPSGTSSRLMTRSKTRPGSILPSRTSGSSSSMYARTGAG